MQHTKDRPVMVGPGKYTYRGYTITKHDGRNISHWRWAWEITDENGGACNVWDSLSMCVRNIDEWIDKDESEGR